MTAHSISARDSMHIWLLQRSEPTPQDANGRERQLRTGILARELARHGHSVVWWTSTFDHYRRVQRYESHRRVSVDPGYQIQYLRGCGYSRNISLSRIRENYKIARAFARLARSESTPPDVIVASVPTAELAIEALNYAERRNIPVLCDIRDLWPDVIYEVIPKGLSYAVRPLAEMIRRNTCRACQRATGILAVTEEILQWGLAHAGRERRSTDGVFYMGYMPVKEGLSDIGSTHDDTNQLPVQLRSDQFVVSFFGTVGRMVDFAPILQAATLLQESTPKVHFVICGAGERYQELINRSKHLGNVSFPGWIDRDQIHSLLRKSSVGLAPYISSTSFVSSIPNKVPEYLAAGVPIALSLREGTVARLLDRERCGFTYENDGKVLAEKLKHMTQEAQALSSARRNAERVYETFFNAHIVYEGYVRHLESLCHNAGRAFHEGGKSSTPVDVTND